MSKILFESLNLSPEIVQATQDMNYDKTTKIQAEAIPLLLEGRDVIGLSGTGTGKTAAFSIPAIEMITNEDIGKVQVLVLCPTRELAMQISDEMRKFSKYKKSVKLATVYGGQSIDLQIRQLRTANIVIGTPGRIMDHMNRKTLKLGNLKTIILDEADEMLNMGFLEDIQLILSGVPDERQTVLFSATMSPEIMRITKDFQTNPALIKIAKDSRSIDNITQFYYEVPQARKMDTINLLLQMHGHKRSLVFCNTKKMVDDLVVYLNDHGFKSEGLHGDMKQAQRTRVMQSYKSGRIHILVATDVAARGIDVDDIEAVFNFDIPQEYEYYIHRIGRTARAGKTGSAYTLTCNSTQIRKVRDIEKYVGSKITAAEIPAPEDIIKKSQDKYVEKIKLILDDEVPLANEYILESLLAQGYDTWKIANVLVSMMVGKDKKLVPVVKAIEKKRTSNLGVGNARVTLKVNIGRTQKIAPNFIVGAIVEGTGLPAQTIGKIDIYNDYTNIEMTEEDAKVVIDQMQGSKIKGCEVHFTTTPAKAFGGSSARSGGFKKPYAGKKKSYGDRA